MECVLCNGASTRRDLGSQAMGRRDLKFFEGSLDPGLGQFCASIRNQNFDDSGDRDFDLKRGI